ncbi:MAG: hypothetical protein WBH75_08350 [Thermoanaerobaculia bacterium]
MELPAEILIHNSVLGMKGAKGTLLHMSELGFYEVNCHFGDKVHRILLPIAETAIILRDPEETMPESLEIER